MFDQVVHMPFLYLPCFYFIREIGKNPDAVLGNIKEKFYDEIVRPAYASWKNCFSADMLVEMSWDVGNARPKVLFCVFRR